MIALFVGPIFVGALVTCWYGYRTLDRIQKWGEKMNELDAIFQSAATAEEMAAYGAHGRKDCKPVQVKATQVPVSVPHEVLHIR